MHFRLENIRAIYPRIVHKIFRSKQEGLYNMLVKDQVIDTNVANLEETITII